MPPALPPSPDSASFFDNEMEEMDVISFKTIEEIERSIVESPFRAIFQYNNFFLPQLSDTIDRDRTINLRPEYQRRSSWSQKQKSLLIESILLNIPIPPVFLFEYELAAYEVMDGQQRIIAIKEYFENEYELSGLSILAPLNGRRYRQLPPRTRKSLDRGSLSSIVLIKESRSSVRDATTQRVLELRKFVFERLNTGGKRLNAQELRNAVYGSEFNELTIRLAAEEVFTKTWGIPNWRFTLGPREESQELKANTLYKSMADCEIVLRFFALRDIKRIKGSMRSILDNCMERNLNLDQAALAQCAQDFQSRFSFAVELFDQRPFRLTKDEDAKPSVAMYDAVIVAIDRLWNRQAEMRAAKQKILESFWNALEGEDDFAKFTGRANTAKDTRERINTIESAFQTALS